MSRLRVCKLSASTSARTSLSPWLCRHHQYNRSVSPPFRGMDHGSFAIPRTHLASSSAAARPMPDAAPVITATRPNWKAGCPAGSRGEKICVSMKFAAAHARKRTRSGRQRLWDEGRRAGADCVGLAVLRVDFGVGVHGSERRNVTGTRHDRDRSERVYGESESESERARRAAGRSSRGSSRGQVAAAVYRQDSGPFLYSNHPCHHPLNSRTSAQHRTHKSGCPVGSTFPIVGSKVSCFRRTYAVALNS
jgi:hypothetical protein